MLGMWNIYFNIPKEYLIVLGLFNWPIFLGSFTIMYYSKLCFFKIIKYIFPSI